MARTGPKRDETSPPNWLEIVVDQMDFEQAFQALEPYDHFHTSTLRGKVRQLQVRTQDAWEHFREAEECYAEIRRPTNREKTLYFYLLSYKFDNACFEEAAEGTASAEAATDRMLRDLLVFESPDAAILDQIKIFIIGNFQLMRNEFRSALITFESLIEESRDRLEDQRVGFFLGAAAASAELGLDAQAEEHYQNAALSVHLVEKAFKRALFYSRLHVILERWGRKQDAADWMRLLAQIPGPEESRKLFIARTKILSATASKKGTIILT